MIGAPIGAPIGGAMMLDLGQSTSVVTLSLSTTITPDTKLVAADKKLAEGKLVSSTPPIWFHIASKLAKNWELAHELTPIQWEEMIAGAFWNAGYDEVIITPRSGDYGRDIIATKNGVGSMRVLGSVKAYKPGHLVDYDSIRAMIGILDSDHAASKGMITTTSDFPPKVMEDPFIKPYVPTRLELMNGAGLQKWLNSLTQSSGS
jgi:restriction system protein